MSLPAAAPGMRRAAKPVARSATGARRSPARRALNLQSMGNCLRGGGALNEALMHGQPFSALRAIYTAD